MAIHISGMHCPLCGLPIYHDQEKVGFSAFVANESDPLYIFSGQVFHLNCFHENPLSEQVMNRYDFSKRLIATNKACFVCKCETSNPDDYLYFPFLTEDKNSFLYGFNHIRIHYSCLPKWSSLSCVYKMLLSQKACGDWKGKALDFLLKKLESSLYQ
jgi:hypothetical protein